MSRAGRDGCDLGREHCVLLRTIASFLSQSASPTPSRHRPRGPSRSPQARIFAAAVSVKRQRRLFIGVGPSQLVLTTLSRPRRRRLAPAYAWLGHSPQPLRVLLEGTMSERASSGARDARSGEKQKRGGPCGPATTAWPDTQVFGHRAGSSAQTPYGSAQNSAGGHTIFACPLRTIGLLGRTWCCSTRVPSISRRLPVAWRAW